MIDRRSMLAATAGATLGGSGIARAQRLTQGRRWVVETVLGSPATIKSVIFDPFDRDLGCTTVQVSMAATQAFAQLRAEKAAPQTNLYMFSGRQELLAANEGLLAELGSVPGLENVPDTLKSPYWVTFAMVAEGILYRTDKVKTPPRSYKDLMRPEYEGHIALAALTNGYGSDFLVMMARANGGDEHNVDPGFRAVAHLAKTATLFKVTAEITPLLAQEDVWVVPYDTSEAIRCQQAGLPVAFVKPEEGSPGIRIAVCIPNGAPDADLAHLAVARFIAPDTQRHLAEQLHWAPTIGNADLPEALQRELPTPSEFVTIDQGVVTAQLPAWIERWDREVAR
jgi:putative spermidine/putrescine transport system substrate-binding protein